MTGQDVAVVIGVGGMGRAIARRLGSGITLALADFDDVALDTVTRELTDDGHAVVPTRLDVGDIEAVNAFADSAADLGRIVHLAHTAGLSPVQASAEQINRVDLVGVAAVLDAFAARISTGATGVVITSMAGHLWPPFADDVAHGLATMPAGELYDFNLAHNDFARHPTSAYATAKAANILRVRAAAASWGRRRGRVNSISPGVIATPMGRAELSSENGAAMAELIDDAALRRAGTPDEIASVAAFLLGPDSSYITGTDILVDGGVVAAADPTTRGTR